MSQLLEKSPSRFECGCVCVWCVVQICGLEGCVVDVCVALASN